MKKLKKLIIRAYESDYTIIPLIVIGLIVLYLN